MVCCDVGGNVRFLVEQKAVVDVVNVVKEHEENAAVLQAAYALILSLLLQGWFHTRLATGNSMSVSSCRTHNYLNLCASPITVFII